MSSRAQARVELGTTKSFAYPRLSVNFVAADWRELWLQQPRGGWPPRGQHSVVTLPTPFLGFKATHQP